MKRTRRGGRNILILAAVFACSLAAAALVICPKCGFEGGEGATTCAHCGAALPAARPAAPAPASEPSSSTGSVSEQALAALRLDLRLANENVVSRTELAYAFYQNALALSRLVKREGSVSAEAGRVLAENVERSRAALTQASRPCPVCQGSGKRSLRFQHLGNEKNAAVAEGLTCNSCGGKGMVRAGRSADELRVLIAQGRRDFDQREQALGRVARGRAWLPSELANRLDVRTEALVRSAVPTPCSDCMGIGLQDCGRCKGAGRIKCTNGCQDGWVIRKENNNLSAKVVLNRREPCSVCQGSGQISCPDCRGAGATPCRTCHGTGLGAACADCGGAGWQPCPTCHGSGQTGDDKTCSDCQGRHERLCLKCHGEGCVTK